MRTVRPKVLHNVRHVTKACTNRHKVNKVKPRKTRVASDLSRISSCFTEYRKGAIVMYTALCQKNKENKTKYKIYPHLSPAPHPQLTSPVHRTPALTSPDISHLLHTILHLTPSQPAANPTSPLANHLTINAPPT